MFDLKKSQEDPVTSDPSIKGPKFYAKLKKISKPQVCHPYSTRSKSRAAPVSVQSVETNIQNEQGAFRSRLVGQKYLGFVKDSTV